MTIINLPETGEAEFKVATMFGEHTELDLQKMCVGGRFRIIAKVRGYWSTDIMTLYVERETKYVFGEDHTESWWDFRLSHSSGGRDTGEVSDDLVAEHNFAKTLGILASFGMLLRDQHISEMEEVYTAAEAARNAEKQEMKRLMQEKVDQDPPLGEARARGLVEQVRSSVRNDGGTVFLQVFARGVEYTEILPPTVYAYITSGGVKWRDNYGSSISVQTVIQRLANSSQRTRVRP